MRDIFLKKWGESLINVLSMLEASASRCPQKTAVREGALSVSYEALQINSQCVGTALRQRGIQRCPVGVYMEKGIQALTAFFGIVYAGGCYCMLNPELPDNRLRSVQEVLQAPCMITTAAMRDKAQALFPDVMLCTVEELLTAEPDTEGLAVIRRQAVDTDPLYINFTSGSTGVPKGIAVAHRSVIDFIGCFAEIFGIGAQDIIANQAPFDFDVSVKDIYTAMSVGATLVIVPRQLFSTPAPLIDYLCEHQVTTLIWAVSALCLVTTFHGLAYRVPDTIRRILFSGEVMPQKHLREWQKYLPDVMYVNLYGPTEITCNCTYHILQKDRDYSAGIPIGQAFPNEDVFLLDEQHRLVTETGKTGMITVRGTALALGYYNMADKTANSFIQNPLNPHYPETVYLTGDLGQWGEDGELYYCGRADNQIKYQGHRIELEEIERAMNAMEGVERCICVFDEKRQRLKGFYVGTIDKNELHRRMSETLPPFMVPGYLRPIETIVLNKNGKIDRKATLALMEGT